MCDYRHMPRHLDAPARDRTVVEAAWRVIARRGVEALTVRNVAAEAGLAPSSLRYTFPTQAAVRERAIGGVLEHLRDRLDALPSSLSGRAWARAALLELLPLDPQRRLEMEVYLALGIAAMTDPALEPLRRQVHEVIADVCRRAAAAVGHTSATEIQLLHALVDGLALHLVVQPKQANTSWALAAVDQYLGSIADRLLPHPEAEPCAGT
jgi:AcrR family transcriptional regulator